MRLRVKKATWPIVIEIYLPNWTAFMYLYDIVLLGFKHSKDMLTHEWAKGLKKEFDKLYETLERE